MTNEKDRSCATPYKTMIGGQALIEGIMMLGPEKKAVVVRKPDGELVEQVEERVLIKDKHPILGVPFLRGVFNFCSSLANGVKALMYSASFFPEDEEPEEPSKFELWLDKRLGSEKAAGAVVTFAVVLGILFALVCKTFATGARSEDMLGSFICAGIGGALMAQIAVNVGMNLRVLPVIGVTLPFYSAGGSSVLMLYICVGLVLSVYMHNTKKLFG